MRVLQLVTRDEPGGVRVLARMVGDGLTARGHEVVTLALRGDGIGATVRHIATGRFDAVLSYQVAAGLLGSLVGQITGVPIRATHLTAIPSAMRPHWRWLDRLWGQWGLHSTVIANSVATLASVDHYPAGYRQRLRLIAHGVAPLPDPVAGNWRGTLGIAKGTPLLVSSGRLVAQKDHATAVAALSLLPSAHLAIAGEGPLRAPLLRQAASTNVADRLHLLGDLDPPRLAGLLAEADVYVFPSTWESFGLAVVEAAMLGLPVVASDLPVLREVLAPALAAFHAPGSPPALAAAVNRMIEAHPDPDSRRHSAIATQSAHSVTTMIDAYCRLLDGSM